MPGVVASSALGLRHDSTSTHYQLFRLGACSLNSLHLISDLLFSFGQLLRPALDRRRFRPYRRTNLRRLLLDVSPHGGGSFLGLGDDRIGADPGFEDLTLVGLHLGQSALGFLAFRFDVLVDAPRSCSSGFVASPFDDLGGPGLCFLDDLGRPLLGAVEPCLIVSGRGQLLVGFGGDRNRAVLRFTPDPGDFLVRGLGGEPLLLRRFDDGCPGLLGFLQSSRCLLVCLAPDRLRLLARLGERLLSRQLRLQRSRTRLLRLVGEGGSGVSNPRRLVTSGLHDLGRSCLGRHVQFLDLLVCRGHVGLGLLPKRNDVATKRFCLAADTLCLLLRFGTDGIGLFPRLGESGVGFGLRDFGVVARLVEGRPRPRLTPRHLLLHFLQRALGLITCLLRLGSQLFGFDPRSLTKRIRRFLALGTNRLRLFLRLDTQLLGSESRLVSNRVDLGSDLGGHRLRLGDDAVPFDLCLTRCLINQRLGFGGALLGEGFEFGELCFALLDLLSDGFGFGRDSGEFGLCFRLDHLAFDPADVEFASGT